MKRETLETKETLETNKKTFEKKIETKESESQTDILLTTNGTNNTYTKSENDSNNNIHKNQTKG